MKVYITDLAAYNNGFLIGKWIDLPMNEDDLQDEIKAVLREGAYACEEDEHEEIFITDYECDYMDIGEYDSLDELNQIAEEMADLSEYDLKRYTAMRDAGYEHETALNQYEDVDLYENMSMLDLAYQFVDEGLFGEIPDHLQNYIDYDAIARDLSYDYVAVNGDIVRVA